MHVLTVAQNKNTHNVCYMVVELNRNLYEWLDEMVAAVQTVLSSEKNNTILVLSVYE